MGFVGFLNGIARTGAEKACKSRPFCVYLAAARLRRIPYENLTYFLLRCHAHPGGYPHLPDPGHPEHSGRWKFSKNMIVLNFTDGHDNTIALPLDSKGTPGTDEGGRPATNELVTAH